MTAAKQKGTAWETLLSRALAGFWNGRYGLAPRRVAQTGALDTGDIHGVSPFVIQAKAYKNVADGIREGVDGAEVQHVRAGEDFGVALVKRPRKSVGQGYAVMTIETWARLLLRLKRAEQLVGDLDPGYALDLRVLADGDLETPFPKA